MVAKLIITITHGGSNQFFVHFDSFQKTIGLRCSFLTHSSDIDDLLEGQNGIMHRDIKLDNIFVNVDHNGKIDQVIAVHSV